jgi:hypothetical protein
VRPRKGDDAVNAMFLVPRPMGDFFWLSATRGGQSSTLLGDNVHIRSVLQLFKGNQNAPQGLRQISKASRRPSRRAHEAVDQVGPLLQQVTTWLYQRRVVVGRARFIPIDMSKR